MDFHLILIILFVFSINLICNLHLRGWGKNQDVLWHFLNDRMSNGEEELKQAEFSDISDETR